MQLFNVKNAPSLGMLFIAFAFLFISCGSDRSNSGDSSDDMEGDSLSSGISMDEAPDEAKIIAQMTKMEEDIKVNEKAKVENITDIKLEEKSAAEKEKEAALKLKIAEEKVKQSKNKGASCAEILDKYEKIAKDFLKSKDIKLLVEMNKQNNDVFFAECRKDSGFQKSIDKINAEVDAALEE